MKRVSPPAAALSSLLTLIYYGSPCLGQGTAAAAETLFQQARADMAAGNYAAACPKLRQSDELDPALGTKLNLADCESRLGHLATAWELFRAVEQKLDPTDNRYPIAVQKRQAIEPQLPKLVLTLANGAPPGTTVREGTAVFGSTAFGVPLPFDPGHHEFTVTAQGRRDAKIVIELEIGKTTSLDVAPGETEPQWAPAPSNNPTATPTMSANSTIDPRPSSGPRTAAYVFGSVGIIGAITAGVAGALTLKEKKTNENGCHPSTNTCDTLEAKNAASLGRTYGAITTAGIAVGVAGLGLGTYFLIKSTGSSSTQTALVTQAGPAGAQLALVQVW